MDSISNATGSTDQVEIRRNGDTYVALPTLQQLFPSPRQAEWDTEYHALALKGRGSPIHSPGTPTDHHIEYRKAGYGIGDVVLFTETGAVDFHFNICVPADSPLNGLPEDIPEGFSPLFPPLDPANVREGAPFVGHTVLEGKSMRKFQIHGYSPGTTFNAVATEMAILTIPEGVVSRDVIDVSCFRKYIAANAIGWYKSVNEVGDRHAVNGDLRVIVGSDRCTSWSRTAKSSITVQIPHNNTTTTLAHFNVAATAGATGVLSSKVGNRIVRDPEGVVHQNQSVFLRTLNISVCDEIWSKLAEDYRPYIERHMPPVPDGTPFEWKSSSIEMHPANGINALLLKQKPRAKFAITQDSDWSSVLKPDDASLPTSNEFLSRILKVYNICEEDDVVFLEYKPEFLYRTYLSHDYDVSLMLPLWQPTIVAVGAVGYVFEDNDTFVTLFNARISTPSGIPSLPASRTNVLQTIHDEQSVKFDLLPGFLNLARKSGTPKQVCFPLKVGEKAAHIYAGQTRHRRFEADELPMEWFKSNIEKIVEIYGPDHNITREDLVLITGTLDTHDYALFVSACHREGSVTFNVEGNPQIGQPWGAFLPPNSGQFTSKVSRHGGPWETVLLSYLRIGSNVVVSNNAK